MPCLLAADAMGWLRAMVELGDSTGDPSGPSNAAHFPPPSSPCIDCFFFESEQVVSPVLPKQKVRPRASKTRPSEGINLDCCCVFLWLVHERFHSTSFVIKNENDKALLFIPAGHQPLNTNAPGDVITPVFSRPSFYSPCSTVCSFLERSFHSAA